MNTYEMVRLADEDGCRYFCEDMYYQKGKGFHEYHGNVWNAGAYEGEIDELGRKDLDAFIHAENWELEDKIRKGDLIRIIYGAFSGIEGKVYDIDTVARENELVVLVPKSKNNDELYLYIDISNVEIIANKG